MILGSSVAAGTPPQVTAVAAQRVRMVAEKAPIAQRAPIAPRAPIMALKRWKISETHT
jgi:hypothetical protein